MKKAVVRKFRETDAEAVVNIFQTCGLIRNEDERERSLYYLRKAATEPKWYAHHLVAELDGRVVGRVILEALYHPYSELVNLYVHPDYWGIGVGSSLVQSCIDIASSLGSLLISSMTDPVGNLPAHRLYSKFGFKPAILGDPSAARGHMWLFRFSERSYASEFLKRHPFAEPSVSQSKIEFHGRMLYRMAWTDPQTKEKLTLYIEGQPSQTLEGTMPRVAGFSFKEEKVMLDMLVQELDKTIRQGEVSKFIVSIWNLGSETLRTTWTASIPEGMELNPPLEPPLSVDVRPSETNHVQYALAWPLGISLPDFTTFSTIPATCFYTIKGLAQPLFASAGFERERQT